MLPYSAFAGVNPSGQGQFGNQAAALQAAMQYMPQIPTYGGPTTNAQTPSLQGPQIPQPGAGMTATNGVLSQVPGLLKYLQGMKGQNGASGSLDNIFNYAQSGGQGNPAMYGGIGNWLSSIFGSGANPYAGMGEPT